MSRHTPADSTAANLRFASIALDYLANNPTDEPSMRASWATKASEALARVAAAELARCRPAMDVTGGPDTVPMTTEGAS
jgi:hypothetical protein